MRRRSMELQRSEEDRADIVGVLCSAACAVHCLATPLIVALVPALTIAGQPIVEALEAPWIHQAVATVGASLACISIVPFAVRRKFWGRIACALTAVVMLLISATTTPSDCCGLLLLLGENRLPNLGFWQTTLQSAIASLPVVGGTLLATVHGLNIVTRRRVSIQEGTDAACCLELVSPSKDFAVGCSTEPLAQAG